MLLKFSNVGHWHFFYTVLGFDFVQRCIVNAEPRVSESVFPAEEKGTGLVHGFLRSQTRDNHTMGLNVTKNYPPVSLILCSHRSYEKDRHLM